MKLVRDRQQKNLKSNILYVRELKVLFRFGVRGFNLRQCRYIGLAKTRLQHILTAAAINLERIYAWLEEIPLAKTRISHFQKLANRKLAIA
jgi:Transposase DDE domain